MPFLQMEACKVKHEYIYLYPKKSLANQDDHAGTVPEGFPLPGSTSFFRPYCISLPHPLLTSQGLEPASPFFVASS